MSGDRQSELDLMLQRVITGEIDPEAPEVLELAARSEEFRSALDELRQVGKTLEQWGASERATAEATVAEVRDGDPELVASAFEAQWGEERPSSGSGSLRFWLVAASLLILAGLGWRFWSDSEPPVPVWMGPADERCEEPRGRVDEYTRFRWRDELQGAETYTLSVFNKGVLDPVLEVEFLREPEYVLTSEDRQRLGDEIYWQVTRTGAATYGAYASRH